MPHRAVRYLKAGEEARPSRAQTIAAQISAAIHPLTLAIYGTPPGYHVTARLKACLKPLGGIPDGRARPSIKRLSAGEIEHLDNALRDAKLP